MKTILSFFFLTAICLGQVTSTPSGCPTTNYAHPALTCPGGSGPIGPTTFYVHNVDPNDPVVLFFGFCDDPATCCLQLPLPLDLGIWDPSLTGCWLLTSACNSVAVVSPYWYVAITVNIPVSAEFCLQAMVPATNTAGFTMTNGLGYLVQ